MARSHTITGWDPEDRPAWQAGGEAIARRNLLWSVAAEHVGFSVWSVMVLFMPQSVYGPRHRQRSRPPAQASTGSVTAQALVP